MRILCTLSIVINVAALTYGEALEATRLRLIQQTQKAIESFGFGIHWRAHQGNSAKHADRIRRKLELLKSNKITESPQLIHAYLSGNAIALVWIEADDDVDHVAFFIDGKEYLQVPRHDRYPVPFQHIPIKGFPIIRTVDEEVNTYTDEDGFVVLYLPLDKGRIEVQLVDEAGNLSKKLDLLVWNRAAEQLPLHGESNVMYPSSGATATKVVRQSLFDIDTSLLPERYSERTLNQAIAFVDGYRLYQYAHGKPVPSSYQFTKTVVDLKGRAIESVGGDLWYLAWWANPSFNFDRFYYDPETMAVYDDRKKLVMGFVEGSFGADAPPKRLEKASIEEFLRLLQKHRKIGPYMRCVLDAEKSASAKVEAKRAAEREEPKEGQMGK